MRILMLGNSLTSANDLPGTLVRLTGAEVVAHTRGGARLAEHLNPATRLGARTQAALRGEQWDFVVLQEMSNGPIRSRERFLGSAERLCAQVREAGARPVLFATWAYAPGSEKLERMGMGYEEMARGLDRACREAAARGDALVADAGMRFLERWRVRRPELPDLYAPDGVHPSAAGSLLAAQTIADALGWSGP